MHTFMYGIIQLNDNDGMSDEYNVKYDDEYDAKYDDKYGDEYDDEYDGKYGDEYRAPLAPLFPNPHFYPTQVKLMSR